MSEYIVDEAMLDTIRRTAYEAGWAGREVYTCKRPSERIVRCRDCRFFFDEGYCDYFTDLDRDPDGYCAWGKLREDA